MVYNVIGVRISASLKLPRLAISKVNLAAYLERILVEHATNNNRNPFHTSYVPHQATTRCLSIPSLLLLLHFLHAVHNLYFPNNKTKYQSTR